MEVSLGSTYPRSCTMCSRSPAWTVSTLFPGRLLPWPPPPSLLLLLVVVVVVLVTSVMVTVVVVPALVVSVVTVLVISVMVSVAILSLFWDTFRYGIDRT